MKKKSGKGGKMGKTSNMKGYEKKGMKKMGMKSSCKKGGN